VHIAAIGYQLAPVVVTSAELEARLAPVYAALRIERGQLQALTGIAERRLWEPGFVPSRGAVMAARKVIAETGIAPSEIEALLYAGVCRDELEPATACHVAAEIGVAPHAVVHDIGNACLGALTGILDLANRIELGQIRAGLVVACESAREIVDAMIARMNARPDLELFRMSFATLTGGSGAVAVLVTDGAFCEPGRRRLLAGVTRTAPEHHNLCRWRGGRADRTRGADDAGADLDQGPFMSTDASAVLKHGTALGRATWEDLLGALGRGPHEVDRVVCHQVGAAHRGAILRALEVSPERDFSTFEHLGNMGSAALPTALAIAGAREFLAPGDTVGLLGIGSGLNCTMLGLRW